MHGKPVNESGAGRIGEGVAGASIRFRYWTTFSSRFFGGRYMLLRLYVKKPATLKVIHR